MTIVLTHRFVRLAVAAMAVAVAATTAASAQEAATYEVVSTFTISFEAGKAPSSLRQAERRQFLWHDNQRRYV